MFILLQAIRDLQNSVRDATLLLRVLLQEIKTNAEKEKAAITSLYDLIQEKITEKKEALLQQAEEYVFISCMCHVLHPQCNFMF